MTEHTKLPLWKLPLTYSVPHGDQSNVGYIHDADGHLVISLERSLAGDRIGSAICRSVNNHDQLLGELKRLRASAFAVSTITHQQGIIADDPVLSRPLRDLYQSVNSAQAAIEVAEKE